MFHCYTFHWHVMAATQDSSPEGFAFEPEYTEEELAKFEIEYDKEAEFAEIEVGLDHGTGSTSGADISRLNNLDWCNCSNCAMMPTLKESLCCKEMKLLEPYLDNLSLTCFVNHTDFSAVCLNRSVLRASFAALKEFKNRGRTVNIPNDFENR